MAARWTVLMVLGLALVVGSPRADAQAGPARTVMIGNFAFTPPILRVAAGTTITWINRDEEPHTVTSTTGAFGSAGLARDETFSQRFSKPGTYQYMCALHPHMKATVVVQ
jgi:plastocyanin